MQTRNRFLGGLCSLAAVWFLLGIAAVARAQTADHVAGLWHFDEGSGTTAYDSSGNGNTGTLETGAMFSAPFKFGDPGQLDAVAFDGSTGYISVADSSSLDIGENLTVEAWIYTTVSCGPLIEASPPQTIVAKWGSERSYVFGLDEECKLEGTVATGEAESVAVEGSTVVSPNVWHHVALVVADDLVSGTMTLYLDGTEDGSAVGPEYFYAAVGEATTIGAEDAENPTDFFHGNIDEVRIWNRALSAEEVLASAQAGLHADWHFDETSGTSAADSSGYNNTGTASETGILGNAGQPSPSFFASATFDGIDDYIDVPDSSTLRIFRTISIDAWIKPNVTNQLFPWIVNKGYFGNGTESYGILLDETGGVAHPEFIVNTNGGTSGRRTVTSSATVAAGHWYHIAGTYDGTDVCIYVYLAGETTGSADCDSYTTSTALLHQSDNDVFIGRIHRTGGTDTYFDGEIDEVHIWARALSNTQGPSYHGHEIDLLSRTDDAGDLFVPEETSQVFPSGGVFSSDWHIGDTPKNTLAVALAFVVPDDPGTTIGNYSGSISCPPKKCSTPVSGANLNSYRQGLDNLAALLSVYRDNLRATALHVKTALSNAIQLGMNVIWSAP
jgi:Concanavalin A-like lectin/glucanases superfamily